MAIDHKQVLDLAANGRWDEAHQLVQNASDPTSCLIHAYLHRVEGDLGNASYWYGRAGERMPRDSVAAEWQRLWERVDGP